MRRGRRGAKERKNKIGLKKVGSKKQPLGDSGGKRCNPSVVDLRVDKEQQALHNAFHAK